MSLNTFLRKIADNMSLPDRDLASEGSRLADEKRKATTGKEGAYSYKAKGQANRGKYRVNVSAEAKELANELGVDIPSNAYTKNRFIVAENAKKFNEALASAKEAKDQQEEVDTNAEDKDESFEVAGVTAPDPSDPSTGLPQMDESPEADMATSVNVPTSGNVGEASLEPGTLDEAGPFANIDTPSETATSSPVLPNELAQNAGQAAELLNQGSTVDEVERETGVTGGQTSAASGVVDFIDNVVTSSGPSDTELAPLNFGGTRGNILTGPQGLLTSRENLLGTGDPDDDFLFSRSLLG